MNHPNITLRYFNARGRAQFLRYYLLVRNIDFTDERVSIDNDFAEWTRIQDDASLTGPFHRLPFLHWGDEGVAETLVIASFLHTKIGDESLLSAGDNLRHQMLRSSLSSEIMHPLGMLLWATVFYEGVKLESVAQGTLNRVQAHLALLENLLQEWQWPDSMTARPITLADCMLWESIDTSLTVFNTLIDLDSLPTLKALHERYAAGTAFRVLLDTKPCQITARPGEAAEIVAIRQALMSDPQRNG